LLIFCSPKFQDFYKLKLDVARAGVAQSRTARRAARAFDIFSRPGADFLNFSLIITAVGVIWSIALMMSFVSASRSPSINASSTPSLTAPSISAPLKSFDFSTSFSRSNLSDSSARFER
jgi:hypothetical protein